MSSTLSDPVVKAAIEALNAHDKKRWSALFTADASFSDDGHEGSFIRSTDHAFDKGREHFTHIDRVEDGGRSVYGRYHSDTWGDFKTCFKFTVKDGCITRLEVGQVP